VSVLVVAQSSSEIPEGIMNNLYIKRLLRAINVEVCDALSFTIVKMKL
jgi:hypothetical protein